MNFCGSFVGRFLELLDVVDVFFYGIVQVVVVVTGRIF